MRIFKIIGSILGTALTVVETVDKDINELIAWNDIAISESESARNKFRAELAAIEAETPASTTTTEAGPQ
jgi:hypothetical protein